MIQVLIQSRNQVRYLSGRLRVSKRQRRGISKEMKHEKERERVRERGEKEVKKVVGCRFSLSTPTQPLDDEIEVSVMERKGHQIASD